MFEIRMPPWLGSDEGPLPGSQIGCLLPVSSLGREQRERKQVLFCLLIKTLIPS